MHLASLKVNSMKKKKENDISKKVEIKEAALRLFTKQGYNAVTNRDIAKEAGVTHALVNYYYQSKENLFETIVREIRQELIPKAFLILNNPETTIEKKIEEVVDFYYGIDLIVKAPDVPFFMFSQIANNSENLQIKLGSVYFIKQIKEAIKHGEIAPIDPINLIVNIMSLIIFPLIIRPLIQNAGNINDKKFNLIVRERKKMILKWTSAMMKAK
jgi:AcrR family transcriptional regulator